MFLIFNCSNFLFKKIKCLFIYVGFINFFLSTFLFIIYLNFVVAYLG